MKIALRIGLAVVLIGLALSSQFIYINFLRPTDPLTPTELAFARHFNEQGIPVRPYAVRHGFSHTKILAVAAYEIKNFPAPFGITECPAEQAAIDLLRMTNEGEGRPVGYRNGRWVLDFVTWGDDMTPMSDKVIAVFHSFKPPK